MINKKVYIGLSKFVLATMIASSASRAVYAKDGDIYNTANVNIGSIKNMILYDRLAIFDLINNINTYGYEVDNKIYNASEVDYIFSKNPGATAFVVQRAIKANLTPKGTVLGTVVSVSAVKANSFKVVFNQSQIDTSKISFSVLRGTSPVAVATTWNPTNTEATITSSADLPVGDYTVNVKNGISYIGTSNVTIYNQKIAKINIISSDLEVINTTSGTTKSQFGHATYQVLDQYGNDITNSYLAQGITWTCEIGNATGNNGILTVTPFSSGTNLLTMYTNTTINARDKATGVIATANLTIAATLKIGETAIVHDAILGTYELTVNSVEFTNERNKLWKTNPAEVYKITYTYKLLSKVPSSNTGLYIDEFDSAIDSRGEVGETYPNNIIKSPKDLYLVGNFCTAETFIGVNNPTTELTLIKKYSTDTGSNFITFIIPANK